MRSIPLADQAQTIVIVTWAMALGAVVGLERQRFSKPAGLRTHMLVAGVAALVTATTAELSAATFAGDPTRGVHAIITGIGFLGAGAILRNGEDGGNPSGLTTAATVLYTAGVGSAVAMGYGITATFATILAFGVLQLLGRNRRGEQH